jgi:hypothetical protein
MRFNATVKEAMFLTWPFISPYSHIYKRLIDTEDRENKLRKLYQGVGVQANGFAFRRFFELLTENSVMPPLAGKP